MNILEAKWMLITIKADAEIKIAWVCSVELRDREVIDETFDKIHKQRKMKWFTQLTSFNFSVFVVWRDTLNDKKDKIVVNIKNLNKIIEMNNYFLSLQFDIVDLVVDYVYIFIIDAMNWFHQFLIRRENRFKLIVVSHREQK